MGVFSNWLKKKPKPTPNLVPPPASRPEYSSSRPSYNSQSADPTDYIVPAIIVGALMSQDNSNNNSAEINDGGSYDDYDSGYDGGGYDGEF
jgi:hypothetical protein